MNSPSPHAEPPLFRPEALAGQRSSSLGTIVMTPHLSTFWISLIAATLSLAVIGLLALGSWQRRVTVTGQLLPAAGLMRVQTPQSGVVVEKRVKEGTFVRKGDVLYVLNSDRVGEDAREMQADIARQLTQRRQSLQAEKQRIKGAKDEEINRLRRRLEAARGEASAMSSQISQQRTLVGLAEDARQRYKGLADKDYIAQEELLRKESELAEQRARLAGLERDALALSRDRTQLEQELESTALRYDNQVADIERQILSADQQLTEAEGRRQVIVTAPDDGVATLIGAELGQRVNESSPLVTLVPSGSPLQARLYAPSSSIGFVRPGDGVQLRYQAFPYQKFGVYEGKVDSVSSSAVNPSEFSGLPVVVGSPGDPVYAVTVQLNGTDVEALGQRWPLQAGMQLEADILQERRKLYEWVLDPLYSVTRRVE